MESWIFMPHIVCFVLNSAGGIFDQLNQITKIWTFLTFGRAKEQGANTWLLPNIYLQS